MSNKMLIMMTSGPDTPTRLVTPFHQAMTAVAMDAEEVTVIFAMEGTRLLKTGVADKIYMKENSENSVYEHMQNAKECGVGFYVCPSSLKLHDMTLQDCIPELDGAMGTASYVELGMRDDVVVFCY